jgi:hypothetical protein
MRTNSDVLNHTHVHVPSANDIKDWARKAISRQRLADTVLVGSTLVLFGLLFSSFSQALLNTVIIGSAPF